MTTRGHDEHREKAVALQYDDPAELPRVLAGGGGEIAQRIVALAEQHNIPVEQNTRLAELLSDAAWGAEINQESFKLVAEVISFLYHVDKEWREAHEFLAPIVGPPGADGAGE